jgi:hypothetical protein
MDEEKIAAQSVRILRAVFRGLEDRDTRIAELETALIAERARSLYHRDWSGTPLDLWEPWEQAAEKYRATARRSLTEEALLPEPGELE